MHYLSDISQRGPTSPYLLVDARRRSRALHDPIFQCDRSAIHPHAPWISRDSEALSIHGRTFTKGIGIATPFVLTYTLDSAFDAFEATIGRDDAGDRMAPWSLAVYLDDVPAGQWACGSEASAYIHVATQGANELVLVGVGPDEHYVILGDARLFASRQQVPKKRRHGTHRRRLLEFDDRLLVDSLALLTARAARRVSATQGPDDRPEALGGFGRTTSSRGADMWAALGGQGDLLRWQVSIPLDIPCRGWIRAVSSMPGHGPDVDDFTVRVDGLTVRPRPAGPRIVERMPGERFTEHQWGYLCFDIHLAAGVHEIEVVNARGTNIAVNRVVLLPRWRRHPRRCFTAQTATIPLSETTRPPTPGFTPPQQWAPTSVDGHHFLVCEEGTLFPIARESGLCFAPDLLNYRDIDASVVGDLAWYQRARAAGKAFTLDLLKGRRIGATYADYLEHMLDARLPFTIHSLFSTTFDAPLINDDLYARIRHVAGSHWHGFHTTEWTDHYNFSAEARAEPRPTTRREAYAAAQSWYQQRAAMHYHDVTAMAGSWRWDHYAAAWSGGRGLQDEPGPSPGAQLNSLFTRGAARQYGRLWHTEIAPGTHDGYAWVENDYMTRCRPHDTRAHETTGCSISWARRMMYLTYMWGTQSLWSEVPAFGSDTTADGHMALSPLGRTTADFFEFTATHPDRGVPYTPIGLVLDRMHGWSGRQLYPDRYPNLTWTYLQPDGGDMMKDALFDLLYPGHFHTLNEHHALAPTPYGDLFDVMLSDSHAEHLAAYPAIFLLGGLADDMDAALAHRLESYVRDGGTLVINVAQGTEHFDEAFLGVCVTRDTAHANRARCRLDQTCSTGRRFTYQIIRVRGAEVCFDTDAANPLVTRHCVGRGTVILSTVPYLLQDSGSAVCFLPHLLEHLTCGLMPFQVFGDVEYALNRREDGWLVTLMNHRGVYKLPTEPEQVFPHQARNATIALNRRPRHATDWINDQPLTPVVDGDRWSLSVHLPPGELRIVHIVE